MHVCKRDSQATGGDFGYRVVRGGRMRIPSSSRESVKYFLPSVKGLVVVVASAF